MTTLQERIFGSIPPTSWQLGKLHHVFHVRNGFKNIGMQEGNLLSLSYGNIVPKDIDTTEGLLPESFETYQIVDPGNIVLRLTDLQNDKRSLRQGLVRKRGIVTSAYDALEVGGAHDSRFWAYTLLAFDFAKYYYSLGGGVRQSINFADFPNEWLTIPSHEIQNQIADFLDRETSRVDQLIEKKQRFVQVLAANRKTVTLHVLDLFEAPAMRTTPETYGTGHFAGGWSVQRVKHVVNFMTSGSRGWSDLLADEGELFLQSGNIGRSMEVNLTTAQRIQPRTGAEAKRTTLMPGDVLVCITGGRTGAVGYVGAIDEPAYINQHICLLRARAAVITPKLLAHFLYSEIGQKQFDFLHYGMKQGLGFAQVGEVKVPIPPLALQPRILQEIDRNLSRIDRLIKRLTTSIACLDEFRSALITAAVTGQIDVASWKRRGETERRLDTLEAGSNAFNSTEQRGARA